MENLDLGEKDVKLEVGKQVKAHQMGSSTDSHRGHVGVHGAQTTSPP